MHTKHESNDRATCPISTGSEGSLISAPMTFPHMYLSVLSQGSPPGMVPVPGRNYADIIDFIGLLHYKLPPFDIDQFEVTNAQFQAFGPA